MGINNNDVIRWFVRIAPELLVLLVGLAVLKLAPLDPKCEKVEGCSIVP